MAIKLEKRAKGGGTDIDIGRQTGIAGATLPQEQIPETNMTGIVRATRQNIEAAQGSVEDVAGVVQAYETARQENVGAERKIITDNALDDAAAELAGFTGPIDEFRKEINRREQDVLKKIEGLYADANDTMGLKYYKENILPNSVGSYRNKTFSDYRARIILDASTRLENEVKTIDKNIADIKVKDAAGFFLRAESLRKQFGEVNDKFTNFGKQNSKTPEQIDEDIFKQFYKNQGVEDDLGLFDFSVIANEIKNPNYDWEKNANAPKLTGDQKDSLIKYVDDLQKQYIKDRKIKEAKFNNALSLEYFESISKLHDLPPGAEKDELAEKIRKQIDGAEGQPGLLTQFYGTASERTTQLRVVKNYFENASNNPLENSNSTLYNTIWEKINSGEITDITTTFNGPGAIGQTSIMSLINAENGITIEDSKQMRAVLNDTGFRARISEQKKLIDKIVKIVQDEIQAGQDSSLSAFSLRKSTIEYYTKKYIYKKLQDKDYDLNQMLNAQSEEYPNAGGRINNELDTYNEIDIKIDDTLRRFSDNKKSDNKKVKLPKLIPNKFGGTHDKNKLIKDIKSGAITYQEVVSSFPATTTDALFEEAGIEKD
tara:strand:- start:4457 stop:6256 length:1800 start_codon:yes stop_codon:yes gene_type:complete